MSAWKYLIPKLRMSDLGVLRLPFDWFSCIRRYALNGTLKKSALSASINFTIAYFVAMMFVENNFIFLHNFVKPVRIPLFKLSIPLLIFIISIPCTLFVLSFVMEKRYGAVVTKEEIDVKYRGGKADKESDIGKSGFAIEFIPKFNDSKGNFSIFIPIAKNNNQREIMEIIAAENRHKVALIVIQHVITVFIMLSPLIYLLKQEQSIPPIAAVVMLLFCVIMAFRIYTACKKLIECKRNENYDFIQELGGLTLKSFYSPFGEGKIVAVMKNARGEGLHNVYINNVQNLWCKLKQAALNNYNGYFDGMQPVRMQNQQVSAGINDKASDFINCLSESVQFQDRDGKFFTLYDICVEKIIHNLDGSQIRIEEENNRQVQFASADIKWWIDPNVNEAWKARG
ncbi:hypothetical protein BIY23_03800 [Wolbachia pipientis]|uniref:Uncharacterized protein n=1 Tax=Wolbachia pipientis TaxID=955 RepID=A0A1E7QJ72_WOLPI|nr:hypothetical protein [Wolbachia pipientis]OEY86518.1 hypothetical protein BIY23_03800 [Wolbachia pipientis]